MSLTKLTLFVIVGCVLPCYHGLGRDKCPFILAKTIESHLLEGGWYGIRLSTNDRLSPDAANCSFQQFYFYADQEQATHIQWNETTCNARDCNSISVDLHKSNEFSNRGELSVDFYNLGKNFGGPNFHVLHLNEHFMMYYFCINGLGRPRTENAWILSRLQFPNKHKLRSVEYQLQSYGLDLNLEDVNQDGCPNLLPYTPQTGRSLLSDGRREYNMNRFYRCIYMAKSASEKMNCHRLYLV
ncbi:uncharacterized protein LOC142351725 [Convolutriloba macropyga]|uniref:uncharacterized protein LOC142351725 n=1 Tax=Convolutriloba macropyga TaxID=536237 RepID=UPI003F51AF70